jgi:hypothetical protein
MIGITDRHAGDLFETSHPDRVKPRSNALVVHQVAW